MTSEPSRSDRSLDRRSHLRYPINAELEYRVTNRQKVITTGRGRTIDISSSGVLFESTLALPRGLRIELSITWPALPTSAKRLELHAEGRTVRMQRNCTAVQLQKYTFRGQKFQ